MEDVFAMYSISYDLWNEIIDDVIEAHAPLFQAMRQMADKIQISRALVDELKQSGIKEIGSDPWQFLIKIEPYDDGIGGFAISLLAAESPEVFMQIKYNAAAARGISQDEVSGFEAEHGLDMDEEIFGGMQEGFDINAEPAENGVLFELVLFDSEDIDKSGSSVSRNNAWMG